MFIRSLRRDVIAANTISVADQRQYRGTDGYFTVIPGLERHGTVPMKVKGSNIYKPPLTGKPEQQRFTVRSGVPIGRVLCGDWRRRPGRPRARLTTPQRHWICSCQPLERDRLFYGVMVERCDGPSWLRNDDDDETTSGVLTSITSRQYSAISGRQLHERTDVGPAVCS